MRARLPALTVVTALLAAPALLSPVPIAAQQPATYRAGVDLVTFGVTVVDKKGNLVTDLARDEFEIVEDGKPQTLEYLAIGDGALDDLRLGLMLDTSGSMAEDLKLARSAAIKFLNLLPQSEDITLVDFDTQVRVTRYPQRDFARVVERIRGRKPDGWTALYDALGVYLDGAADQEGRPVLVMYTDGADSRSNLTWTDTLNLLKASRATVYAVGLVENTGSARHELRMKLQQITELTGGQAFFPTALKDLDKTYEKVLEEIKGQYHLGYASTNLVTDGAWRKVEIKAKRPDLKIRTRKGYFGPFKPSQ